MRFRAGTLATIVLCITLLYAAYNSTLQLYIHPRYITFTVTLTILALVVLLTDLVISVRGTNEIKTYIVVIAVAVVALVLPPQSLSQNIATTRSTTAQSNNQQTNQHVTIDSFSQDLTRFDIADWNNFLSLQPSDEQIIDKRASVTGFIYDDDAGQRYVARFRLTCCAVDATPLSIPLMLSDDIAALRPGSWVDIEGVFVSDEDIFKIDTTKVELIPEPEQPYVY